MRADKRRATFGVRYWQRQHPDAPVGIYLMRRKWRRFGLTFGRAVRAMASAITMAFKGLSDHVQGAAVAMAEANRAAAMPDFTLVMPDLSGPELVDEEPEWYGDGPNPWDAHTMTFDGTIDRIDQALELHQDGEWQCES